MTDELYGPAFDPPDDPAVKAPVWRRWAITVPFAIATIWGAYSLRPIPAEASRVSMALIQQDADSAQYAVAWGVATGATHYRVYTGPDDPVDGDWEVSIETTELTLTLWVPLNATETIMFMCVEPINRQSRGERRGPPACTTYTSPAALVTPGQPGVPTVTPVGQQVAAIDSVSIFPRELTLEVGQSETLRAYVWVGDVPTICVTLDATGEKGWLEVELDPVDGTHEIVDPLLHGRVARFLPDLDCGYDWASSSPDVVTVEPNPEVNLGPDPPLNRI